MQKQIKEDTPSQEMSLASNVTQALSKVNNVDIDKWLAAREEFIKKVSVKMVEGKDYHIIQDRKSLAKGGAEKIASIFKWTAEFIRDAETLEMLGNPKGILAYVCNLKNGEFVGQGRGARDVVKDKGDINKAIKMAQKSAYIDAVLRASGLSDIFTQDLEDMNLNGHTEKPAPVYAEPITDKQKGYIKALLEQKGIKRLQDVSITDPGVKGITAEWASGVIKELLAMPNKSVIEQEDDERTKELEEIGDSIK